MYFDFLIVIVISTIKTIYKLISGNLEFCEYLARQMIIRGDILSRLHKTAAHSVH